MLDDVHVLTKGHPSNMILAHQVVIKWSGRCESYIARVTAGYIHHDNGTHKPSAANAPDSCPVVRM